MTDIWLMHGSEDFYPSQLKNNWNTLSRSDRQIYFLSNGSNSCQDIAFLLKKQREFIRNRLCILFLQGYITFNVEIRFDLMERSLRDIQEYRWLCVLCFYSKMNDEFTSINNRVQSIDAKQLESEFFSFLKFIFSATARAKPGTIETLISIIEAYRLQTVQEQAYDVAIQSTLFALAYCLQNKWNNDLNDSWRRSCSIIKCALLALNQQI